jgi:hypothetical protein
MTDVFGKKRGVFDVKKVMNYSFAFVFVLSLLVSSFTIGSKSVSAASYDNTNPYSTGCASNKPVTYQTKYIYKGSTKIGYIQLKGSAGCHTAWTYIKLYNPAPRNGYANAYIVRYSNGMWRDCNSSGGNGDIDKGQTSCYTPQIYDLSPYKARGEGYVDYSNYSAVTSWF